MCEGLKKAKEKENHLDKWNIVNEKIKSQVGKIIKIALESNPSTGYEWIPKFDEEYLQLIKKEFQSSSERLGVGGIENFEYEPLKSGETTLQMVYKRSWEKKVLDQKTYKIQITQ